MQINRRNWHSCKSLILLALSVGVVFAMSARSGWSQTVLTYSQLAAQRKLSSILKSPRGVAYRLFLSPELDTGKHIVVVDLVLQKLGSENGGTNLLDSTGRLHGYQPYIFAASDFSQGAQKSVFGGIRTIALDRLNMKLIIKVKDSSVSPTTNSQTPGYQFDTLTLEITTDNTTKGRSKNSTP